MWVAYVTDYVYIYIWYSIQYTRVSSRQNPLDLSSCDYRLSLLGGHIRLQCFMHIYYKENLQQTLKWSSTILTATHIHQSDTRQNINNYMRSSPKYINDMWFKYIQISSDLKLTSCSDQRFPHFSMSICFHRLFHGRATLCPWKCLPCEGVEIGSPIASQSSHVHPSGPRLRSLRSLRSLRCVQLRLAQVAMGSLGVFKDAFETPKSLARLPQTHWKSLKFTCIGTITFERKSDHGPSRAKKAYRDANKLPRSKMKNRLQVWPCQVQMTTVPVKLSSIYIYICF